MTIYSILFYSILFYSILFYSIRRWPYDVLRRYAADKQRVMIEVGEAASTKEGRFCFMTEKLQDGKSIVYAIKMYIQIFSENENPLYRTIRRPSVTVPLGELSF